MKAKKRELFLRNKAALELNKNMEDFASKLVGNIKDEDFKNEVEAMVFMLLTKSEEITFDVYTVECLIDRARKPEVLEWCGCLIESIEKKIALLNNSCELVRSILDRRAAEGGVFEQYQD